MVGALEDARIMSGFFIEKGPIVQIRNPRGGTEILKDGDPEITYDGPLIIMTNRFSPRRQKLLQVPYKIMVGRDRWRRILTAKDGPSEKCYLNQTPCFQCSVQPWGP